ncbi:CHC2 zinc finger domain-containing protein [Pedobacter nutrimenti]|uniref:CHC2 zinc finger domain-containing protein n=1 Tax=Pedobacter nutrimenti TaxID=1241337 RepID=UPI0029309386|nr:CHC2 zinc finger domain-containing protein [Pedobacter nutrimenti]
MGIWKKRLSCKEVREIDMVAYLSSIGFEPAKIRGEDYWYLSPFREEKTPSFKISGKRNRFYDFGEGYGGNLIDFGTRFHKCTVAEFLAHFTTGFSFQKPIALANKERIAEAPKIIISLTQEISAPALIRYLQLRCIPLTIAQSYCSEIRYHLYGRRFFGLGFKNYKGGFEIRNPYFKASSSPKGITTIRNGFTQIAIFEGFFDFLSFLVLFPDLAQGNTDFLILNSLSFFDAARPVMESYAKINLYLDHNTTGQNCSRLACSQNGKYNDQSHFYQGYEDLNDFLCHSNVPLPKSPGTESRPP